MAIRLYEVKQHGRQIADGKIQLTQTAVDGMSVLAAISSQISNDVESQNVWLKVVYRDGNFNAEARETSLWTWSTADNTINRVANSTFTSSAGGAPVNWDPNVDVTVYSVDPPAGGVRTLQEDVFRSGADFTLTDDSVMAQFSPTMIVQPRSNLSRLIVDIHQDFSIASEGQFSSDDLRIDIRPACFINNGQFTLRGSDRFFGYDNFIADTNGLHYINYSDSIIFGRDDIEEDSSNVNFGSWVICVAARPEYAHVAAQSRFVSMHWREVLIE